MTEQTTPKTPKAPKQIGDKRTGIGRMTLPDVDAALSECEKTIKSHTDLVKAKLSSNGAFPANVLRELSRANVQKLRLVSRRISLLIESGDSAVLDLIDKLMKIKPAR